MSALGIGLDHGLRGLSTDYIVTCKTIAKSVSSKSGVYYLGAPLFFMIVNTPHKLTNVPFRSPPLLQGDKSLGVVEQSDTRVRGCACQRRRCLCYRKF